MRVLVTGAGSQLADAIIRAFADREVVAHGRASLDIVDAEAVQKRIGEAAPDVIINCAAFNDVDGAEDRAAEALAANAFGVRSLARAADACRATLVHYGSDFVFDGTATEPYDEAAAPAPRSVYSASKLLGDWFALEASRVFVLRVESLFGVPAAWTGRRGTLDKIVDGLQGGREVAVFVDRVVSPTYIEDVAAATRHLVDGGGAPGLYHCVNSGRGTWYEVASEAATVLGVTPRLKALTMEEVTLKAARPRFCALANGKLQATGFNMPTWQDALRRWLTVRSLSGHRMDSVL